MSPTSSRRLFPLGRILLSLLTAALLAGAAHGQLPGDQTKGDERGSAIVPSIDSEAALPATPTIRESEGGREEERGGGHEVRKTTFSAPAQQSLKPLPPNEFQRYVQENFGQMLPLFGSGFFSQPQGTFDPRGNVPVSPDYKIGPGDELQIRGWGAVNINVRATVDRNGQIHIPRIGSIDMNGVRSAQAEDVVRSAVARYYRDFQLSVTLGQLKGITIYVVGQARRPGAYSLSSASTLVSALFTTGGPNATGSMRKIQVKRGGKTATELDLYTFLSKGDKSADIRLQDGDTIVIPSAGGYVALSGKVSTPAVYELSGAGDTLGDILALAGGLPVVADPTRVQLERIDPQRKPPRSVEVFALDAPGLRTPLRSGDILSVSSVVPKFGNAVTLRGNVAEPLRSPWREGMKVTDLIPSRAFLMSRASVKRQNEVLLSEDEKLRANSKMFNFSVDGKDEEEWRDRAQEKDGKALAARDQSLVKENDEVVGDSAETLAQRIGNLIDQVNFDYAVIERVDNANLQVKLLSFNLGNALNDPASPDNLPLQPGDIVTIFSVNDVRVPHARRQVFVRVEGEVMRPGVYQMASGETLPQLLDKAGGLTPDAHLFGAEFYREEVRQAQLKNLSQLVRRLEMQMQTKLSQSAASVSLTADANAAQLRLQAEAQAQKQALERLRSLNPSGRIMLGMASESAGPEQLPKLRLENRDRLVIPSKPDFVYVLGAVNTESSLIYERGRSIGEYLEQSGLTGGADVDEMFVIRADGSVLSNYGRWFSSITKHKAQPGDVIVLPEKTDHESAWSVFTRNAKDITQIIYQFSLGAAAIKTLRE